MYAFLVWCLSKQIVRSVEPATSTSRDNQNETISLLDLSAQLQYKRPDQICWDQLADMSKASADDALDDLWQLRTDAEYWNMRFTDMQMSTSRLLRSVLGRIDVLLTVDEELRVRHTDFQTSFSDDGSVIRIPCGDSRVQGAIFTHSTFRSIINEMLSSLQKDKWLHSDQGNRTLRYLFDLIAKNDPSIRLMGVDTVLRTIERELLAGNAGEILPFPIAQAFHDMSVVAACMQETSKHINRISKLDIEYARLVNSATYASQARERPWRSLAQGLQDGFLSQGNEFKINGEARDKKASLDQRHRKFWNIVDDCMRLWNDSGASNSAVSMIFSHAPVPRAPAGTSASTMLNAEWDRNPTPTATQTKKSNRRRLPEALELSPDTAVSRTAAEPRSKPPVYITRRRDISYWDRLRNQKRQQDFKSWAKFLEHVGFKKTPQIGSVYSFKLEAPEGESYTIIFHAAHGRNGNKITHDAARGMWSDRLRRHFNVIVSEAGNEG